MITKINIPWHEIEVTASRSGGPGGQHVNKTSSRITLRWNIENSSVLTPEEKDRVKEKLKQRLTDEGDILLHVDEHRSQHQNKELAYQRLNEIVNKALKIKKRRMKTKIPRHIQEKRLEFKRKKSALKKLRSSFND